MNFRKGKHWHLPCVISPSAFKKVTVSSILKDLRCAALSKDTKNGRVCGSTGFAGIILLHFQRCMPHVLSHDIFNICRPESGIFGGQLATFWAQRYIKVRQTFLIWTGLTDSYRQGHIRARQHNWQMLCQMHPLTVKLLKTIKVDIFTAWLLFV